MSFRYFTVGIAWQYLGILLIFGANDTPRIVNAFRSSLGEQHRAVLSRQLRFGTFPCVGIIHSLEHRLLPTSTSLSCGLLDALQNAFGGSNRSTTSQARKATASHILIQGGGAESKTRLLDLKAEIGDDPLKFGEAAAKYSDCSSASKGGDLGEFERGTMSKEFESTVFDLQTPIGVVQGPIPTEFGYHLILVKERIE